MGGAKLFKVDLSDTALSAARFNYAHLDACNLSGASFDAANFGGTNLLHLNLSAARSLALARHTSPSSISTDTLFESQGRIPEAFLRGCGLSDVEIITTKLWDPDLTGEELNNFIYRIHDLKTTAPIQKRHVFISYAHADKEFVEGVEKRFDAKGIRYWRDTHDLKAGRIETQIDRAIGLHSIVLLVLSKHSVASDWVEWEISKARAIEKQHKRDVICPVALDDSWKTADWPGPLRRQIEDYHILDLSSPTEAQFTKLIDGLNLFY
jgi:hypothetical protein